MTEESVPEERETTEFRDDDGNHISLHYDPTGGTQSYHLDKLAEALSLAQSEIDGASKSSKNEFQKYNYADLNAVITAIKVPFGKYGLSHTQLVKIKPDGTETLITRLMHKSGQWLASEITIIPMVQRKGTGWVESKDPQTRLAAITYMRRGALAAIAGIGQEDLEKTKDHEEVVKGSIKMPTEKQEQDEVVKEGIKVFGGKEVPTPDFKLVTKAQVTKLQKKTEKLTPDQLKEFYAKAELFSENVADIARKDYIKTMKVADVLLGDDIPF